MTLVPWRILAVTMLAVFGLAFMLGLMRWDDYKYKCIDGRKFQPDNAIVLYEVWRIQIMGFPYDCSESEKYNPKELKPVVYPTTNPSD